MGTIFDRLQRSFNMIGCLRVSATTATPHRLLIPLDLEEGDERRSQGQDDQDCQKNLVLLELHTFLLS